MNDSLRLFDIKKRLSRIHAEMNASADITGKHAGLLERFREILEDVGKLTPEDITSSRKARRLGVGVKEGVD